MKEFEDTKKIVSLLLSKEERCRNDDRWLIFRFMEHKGLDIKFDDEGMVLKVPKDKFEVIPNFETVRRVRAEIQNEDGKFLPTDPKVLISRRIREELIREHYSKDEMILSAWEEMRYEVR